MIDSEKTLYIMQKSNCKKIQYTSRVNEKSAEL